MKTLRAGAAVVFAIALITTPLTAPAVADPPSSGAQGIGD
jgi:hypothetical protein